MGCVVLPAEYTQVEYLESTGTQYIDLGLVLNVEEYAFYFRLIPTKLSGSTSTGYNGIMGANSAPQVGFSATAWTVGNGSSSYPYPPEVGKIYEIEYSKDFYGGFFVDGEYVNIGRRGNMTCKLFRVENRTTNSKVKLFEAHAINTNNELVYSLIPCLRNSDDKPGMYDTVSGTFYTNDGTGEFLYGGVVLPDTPNLMESRKRIVFNTPHMWNQ